MKRSFCVGSEWLYYKVYTGVKTADIVLAKVYPILTELKQSGVLSHWFFIRYKDPDEHLRLRFYCDAPQKTAQVILALYPVFNDLIENDLVWKLQTDTYNREIERYGENTIELSEHIFHLDSEMVVNYLAFKPHLIEIQTELLFSLLAIDAFLNGFGLDDADKLALVDELQLSFKKEFQAEKYLKKELDKNYRLLAARIDRFLNVPDTQHANLTRLTTEKQNHLKPIISGLKAKLQVPLFYFLQSHIHMMVNRQYTSKQRQYECLIYDHLHRHYKKSVFLKNQR
jgi:thiopeptide-type bacteriocin biosynthesis protein